MPLPKPNSGESESDFMSRCVSDDKVRAEFPNQDQRVAVCLGSFRSKKEEQEMSDQDTLELENEEKSYETGSLDIQAEIKAEHDEEEKDFDNIIEAFAYILTTK